ncbi:gamma-butyrobetaine dioxygenase-like isoform X2 [Acanthaster planci]|nr:gamma-butyrobetaine dioxygenase-like isoform X2 [Acanthaster planci]XP_022082912.1 gamma-butyrobetaine dioxygenase-like isoform X2 [Acanthaster planci]XP_022082913.1 gamma-butyrobetaine dioxygenase-like isoform X2 [Acanthaster planci]XP_022082914.1 gamma-butyrobetaine dioxygenase-like isoform X2 [Acanthaster planci]
MASDLRLMSLTRDDAARWYRVAMDSGYEGTYPYVWLRDNCRCSECFSPPSLQRMSKMSDLDPEVMPLSEELLDEGSKLRVTWPDQHRSEFDAAWLNRQRFSEMQQDTVSCPIRKSWGAELNGRIPAFDFQKLLQDDLELYNWLDVLNTKGLALVKGAPTEKGPSRQLAERVAFLKRTFYGEVFEILRKQDASNIAYAPTELGLHVDQLYLYHLPGVQMLHCIERTNIAGGENQFVDGLHVAQQIRTEFPAAYQLLTTQEIDFRGGGTTESGNAFHLKSSLPTIKLDRYGEFQSIHFCDVTRAPYLPRVPVAQVTELYRALKLLYEIMYRPENLVRHQLAGGEMVTFNNVRVLHARKAYTFTGEGSRHLEGGYIGWDEVHSRMRVLHEKIFGDVRL